MSILNNEGGHFTQAFATPPSKMDQLRTENLRLRDALKAIEKELGIRPDFVPLGPALPIASIIRDALKAA